MSHPNERDLALRAGGDLPAGEAARLESHLAACPDCRALAERLRDSRAAVASLAAEPIDEIALARVRHGLRSRLAEEEARAARRRRSAVWTLAAALVAAALGLGLWYLAARPEPADELAHAERPAPPAPDRRVDAPPPRERPEARPGSGDEPDRASRAAPRQPEGAAPPPEVQGPAAPDRSGTPPSPHPEPPAQRVELAAAPAGPTESMVIKVVSDDPDIVYYWLVEPTSS